MQETVKTVDYDKIGRVYDSSRVANTETVEKLIALLGINCDSLILDIGCGTGNYSGALSRVAKSIVGIDLSSGMLRQAHTKFSSLPFVRGDVTSLPFASEIFDGAFAIQVLHHLRYKEKFLREAYRVLRKGACFAIDSCSHQQMRTFWLYYYFPAGLEIDLERIPDSDEIMALFQRTEFRDIDVRISYSDIAFEHEKPERYLDNDYRTGQSTFGLLRKEDVDEGCEKLRADIASGIAEKIVRQYESEEGRVGGSCIIYGRKSTR